MGCDFSFFSHIIQYMRRFLFFLFLAVSLGGRVNAQVIPKEGSKLYYRIIGFSFPAQTWAVKYGIEVAVGNYTSEQDFGKNISVSLTGKNSKIIGEVPYFGSQYTWRVVFFSKGMSKTKSILYHFSTRTSPDVDTNVTRLRVTKSAEKYKDAYVFLDGTRVLYDMKGSPVWFLPGSDQVNRDAFPRDLKATSYGTITFIAGFQPFEITYSGKLLWQYTGNQPGRVIDSFHHEFTHLQNGHYMGMECLHRFTLLPDFKDSIAHNNTDSMKFYQNTQYSCIVEYDANNKLVWRWNGLDYKNNSDLSLWMNKNQNNWDHDLHENAFYFDEQHKTIYLSFRNISRVIKISYPDGKVLNTYGTICKPGVSTWGNELFCNQHSCKLTTEGHLYVFNNNTCGSSHIPKIEVMQEPGKSGGDLKKLWEYQCTLEDSVNTDAEHFHSGGNVIEIPGKSFFVSMSKPYCKVFIVNNDKKVLWSAMPEKYNVDKQKWEMPFELYRASIIPDRAALEKLIWASEKEE